MRKPLETNPKKENRVTALQTIKQLKKIVPPSYLAAKDASHETFHFAALESDFTKSCPNLRVD